MDPECLNRAARERLKALVKKGWKQSAIAEAIGASRPWLSRYLRAKTARPLDTVQLVRFAEFTGVSLAELCASKEDTDRPVTPVGEFRASATTKRRVRPAAQRRKGA